MNRRDAIKKLAAGGAVAAGASVVLSSNDVAFAASPPDTGLTNAPGPGEPLPLAFTPNSNGTVTMNATSPAACISGGTPTVMYSWKVNSFSFSGGNRHLLLVNANNLSQVIHDTQGSTNYSPASTSLTAVELRKTNNGKKRNIKPLDPGDTYNISVLISWQCAGANSVLEAEYTITGSGSAPPGAANSSYNIF
jgi:hypothetical protein